MLSGRVALRTCRCADYYFCATLTVLLAREGLVAVRTNTRGTVPWKANFAPVPDVPFVIQPAA